MKRFLKDHHFKQGFNIGYTTSNVYSKEMLAWKFTPGTIKWKLAQWGTRFPLYSDCTIKKSNEYIEIFNEQKRIRRYTNGVLELSIQTDKEYLHDRLDNEEWPHLLIEQSFSDSKINKLKNLYAEIDFDFLDFKDHMNGRNGELHTFQVSWYFCIGNHDRDSLGFDDFFWFGLPFIDTPRLPMGKPYEAQDEGKEDSTKKYIVSIDPKLYIKKPTEPGDNFKIHLDILPYIKEAYGRAKAAGYLRQTEWDNLSLISTNFGIEDTGTFDGTLRINYINIYEK